MIALLRRHFTFVLLSLTIPITAISCAGGDLGESATNGDEQHNQNQATNSDTPTPCHDNTDCDGDDICVVDDSDQGICESPDDDVGDGDSCDDDTQCESGSCVDEVCVSECGDDTDCLEMWSCDADGICQPPTCASDGDCPTQQFCSISADGDALQATCLPDNDGGDAGHNCDDHGDCRSRYCVDGRCSAPCDDGEFCGTNQICEETLVSLDDAQEPMPICIPMQVELCTAPIDCDHSEMTCNSPTYDADGDIDGASCGFTNSGGADVGQDCSSSSDCESNFCRPTEDGTTGECSVFCEESERDCAADQDCARMTDDIGICTGRCDTDADCQGGNICTLGSDPDGELITYCEQPVGDGAIGDECSSDGDCQSSICLSNVVTYDAECIGDEQCPDGAECGCPSTDPGCDPHICYIETTQCSRLCDPENADADCNGGDHDMTRCSDDVTVTTDAGTHTAAMCALET